MADAVQRMQDDSKTLQRSLRGAQEKLAGFEAAGLLTKGQRVGDRLVIAEALDGWDAQSLKTMAVAAAGLDSSASIALFTTASPALAVIARGAASTIDAGAILKAMVAKFGGKGGGKSDLAQGGGLAGSPADLVDAARALLGA
jgi:alanyl-tRNA synthetase